MRTVKRAAVSGKWSQTTALKSVRDKVRRKWRFECSRYTDSRLGQVTLMTDCWQYVYGRECDANGLEICGYYELNKADVLVSFLIVDRMRFSKALSLAAISIALHTIDWTTECQRKG